MINNEGYIYIYKCIVGSRSDVIKVGKTKHFNDNMDRMKQHSRTLYYGFVPYTDFKSGNPISTTFKVNDREKADFIIKELLKDYQLSNIEIYNIEYEEAIKKIYWALIENKLYVKLYEDSYTNYDFLKKQDKAFGVQIKNCKAIYEDLKNKIINKYGNDLPDELIAMLRDKNEYIENCSSHYNTGNYIDGFPNNMILDTNFNKKIRAELLEKLKSFL